jgi:endonuclease/exonuclease/phosphatase family metal-dependent hydrolase
MDTPADGDNSWRYRKDVAASIIKANNVDIVGAQEVLHNQLIDLKERLSEYNIIGVGREDGKEKGEYAAIFYKKDSFEEIKSGHFWISETPEIPGSKGWDAACERIATWAILKNIKTKKHIFILNTHLDHVGEIARKKGVVMILEKIEQLNNDYPVVITGDFNSTPETDAIKTILNSGKYEDSRLAAKETIRVEGTYHEYGTILKENRDIIDFIIVSNSVEVELYNVLQETLDGIYLSDHAPVISKIKI